MLELAKAPQVLPLVSLEAKPHWAGLNSALRAVAEGLKNRALVEGVAKHY